MRTQAATTFDTTIVISAPSNAKDGAGGASKTYAPVVGGTVRARIGSPSVSGDKYAAQAGKVGLLYEYVVTLPYNAPINADNRVSFGGQTYAVVLLATDQSINTANRAYVARVSNG